MESKDFRDGIVVEQKKLIPREPLEKCLWVMKATNKISNFGSAMRQKSQEVNSYPEHNWKINKYLGDLEYQLREGEIDKQQFEEGCNKIYEMFGIDFDILRENLLDIERMQDKHSPDDEVNLSSRLNQQMERLNRRQEEQSKKEEQHEEKVQEGESIGE